MEGLKNVYDVAENSLPRHKLQVLAQTVEEVGELSTEIAIDSGFRLNKESGPDGIIGEACDVMVTVLDIIYLAKEWESYSEFKEHISEILISKSNKWKDSQTK